MGTPVPFLASANPPTPGMPCNLCWGPGKPFGKGQTPAALTILIEGVVKGPGWFPFNGDEENGEHIVYQVPGTPCTYESNDDPFLVQLILFVANTSIVARNETGTFYFASDGDAACEETIDNENTTIFINGTATILLV